MNDQQTTLHELRARAAQFIAERDWNQFHNPKSLSMNIAIESAELMEKFLWCTNEGSFKEFESNRQEIEDELADVLLGLMNFANAAGIDLSTALRHKLALAEQKYPVEKAKGRSDKYNKL